jgi:hypothetical protein
MKNFMEEKFSNRSIAIHTNYQNSGNNQLCNFLKTKFNIPSITFHVSVKILNGEPTLYYQSIKELGDSILHLQSLR